MLTWRSQPSAAALEGPSHARVWWWRIAGPRAGGATRLGLVASIVALALAASAGPWGGLWPPRHTVVSSCFPFQATVPLTWRVATPVRAAEACGADSGSFVLRVPSADGPMILTVERQGRALTSDILRLLDYERGSRSGLSYTFVSETGKVQSALVISDGVVYIMRCERGAESACHQALVSLLDNSRFVARRAPS